MKKSLLALAVLGAFAGAASAQTNVTIYGVADIGISRSDTNATEPVWGLNSGIQSGSRLGFKGSEDLGGGLKAIFQLESGFALDTGTLNAANQLFGRQAYVGLAGNFGAVTLGRQYSPYHIAVDTIDPFETGLAGDASNQFSSLTGYPIRVNNSIAYSLPSNMLAGVSGTVLYGFGETAGDFPANRQIGVGLGYAAGPLNAQFAYHTVNTTTPGVDTDANIAFIGAKYNFGIAAAHVAFADKKLDPAVGADARARNYLVGASVPFGAGTFLASWTRSDFRRPISAESDTLAIGYVHNLSKRTNLYTSYGRTDNDAVIGADANIFNVGIRHKF